MPPVVSVTNGSNDEEVLDSPQMKIIKRVGVKRTTKNSKKQFNFNDIEEKKLSGDVSNLPLASPRSAPPPLKINDDSYIGSQDTPLTTPSGRRIPGAVAIPFLPPSVKAASVPSHTEDSIPATSTGGGGPPPIPVSSPSNAAGGPPPIPVTTPKGPPPTPTNITSSASSTGPPPTPVPALPTSTSAVCLVPATPAPLALPSEGIFKALHQQVASARSARGDGEEGVSPLVIQTYFPPEARQPSPASRSNDDVFLCGPIGHTTDVLKKPWTVRWGVLYRDHLSIYSKFSDSKPRLTVSLEGCLVSSVDDPSCPSNNYISIQRIKSDPIYLRAELSTSNSAANILIASSVLVPDAPVLHKAWYNALRIRTEALEYVRRCETNKLSPDERVLSVFDNQVRSPHSHHVNMAYAPSSILSRLVQPDPNSIVSFTSTDSTQSSGLTSSGLVLDLGSQPWSILEAKAIANLLSDPNALPTKAIRFGTLPMGFDVAETFIIALASNTASGLDEVDLSGAAFLSNPEAPALIAHLFTSSNLKRLNTISIRSSDLDDSFLISLQEAIFSAKSSQRGYGCVSSLRILDLSHNTIGDKGFNALTSVFINSLSLSNTLSVLNISNNPIGDTGIIALCKWFKAPRPVAGSTTAPLQNSNAPYRAYSLQHFLARNIRVSDAACVELSAAFVWHVTLSTLDLLGCNRIGSEGGAALAHLCQLNESLDFCRFQQYRLTSPGLTAMRLMYRFGICDPKVYDESLVKPRCHYTNAVIASEYPPTD